MASLLQSWLAQQVQSYPAPDALQADIHAALARFPALRPKADVYTFDDGRSQLLLCLHGLLPIRYRQASYNIPLSLWIPRDYPRHPPLVYVVPTPDMLVRPGPHLDPSGRCSHAYLQAWERKPEGCNLSSLLDDLQDQFSREPPVYSKPSTRQEPPRPPPPPVPARPPVSAPPKPPPPPRPSSEVFQAAQSPLPSASQPPTSPANPRYHLVAPPTTTYFAPPPAPPPPPPPPPPQPAQPSVQVRHPIPNLLDDDDETTASPPQQGLPHSSLGARIPPDANPPPRPPNPELLDLHRQVHHKLTSELHSLSEALALDAERLRAHQNDLLAGEPAIRDEMARLEAVRDVCRSVADRTRLAVQKAETNIAELRRKGDPEVDELVCATSIVHNQLINLVAEDNAIEDTIYHLHRGLNTGRIDLERFLRTTRVLAEEQFMKRALINKIQAGVSPNVRPEWA